MSFHQWAYNAINPKLGAAKADVWRYAVMWCYGGFYMDYDSDFSVLLDDAILPTDTLLVAQDGTPFHDYFRPAFKISNPRSFKNGTTIAGRSVPFSFYSAHDILFPPTPFSPPSIFFPLTSCLITYL